MTITLPLSVIFCLTTAAKIEQLLSIVNVCDALVINKVSSVLSLESIRLTYAQGTGDLILNLK